MTLLRYLKNYVDYCYDVIFSKKDESAAKMGRLSYDYSVLSNFCYWIGFKIKASDSLNDYLKYLSMSLTFDELGHSFSQYRIANICYCLSTGYCQLGDYEKSANYLA